MAFSITRGESSEKLQNLETPSMITKQKSTTRQGKMSKVKQLASMFNCKISQMIKGDASNYNILVNEFSPEFKLRPAAATALKTRPIFHTPKAAISLPRTKSVAVVQEKFSACFVPENEVPKLSVKDKALLYTQFVEEMAGGNGKRRLVERNHAKTTSSDGEENVIIEKQDTVKYLIKKVESQNGFPKSTQNVNEPAVVVKKMKSNELKTSNENLQQEVDTKAFCLKDEHDDRLSENEHKTHFSDFEDLVKEAIAKLENTNGCSQELKQPPAVTTALETEPILEPPTENEISKTPQTYSTPAGETDESESGVSSLPIKNNSEEELRQTKTTEPELKYCEATNNSNKSNATRKRKATGDITAHPTVKEPKMETCTDLEFEEKIPERLQETSNMLRKFKTVYRLTAISDLDTPICSPRNSQVMLKQPQQSAPQVFETSTPRESVSETDFNYSTPRKPPKERHSFAAQGSTKLLCSPISKIFKNRRRSLNETKTLRNSLVMQVIKEEQPLENQGKQEQPEAEKDFFQQSLGKTSQFWIKCGDFTVAFDIYHVGKQRLHLWHKIFCQTPSYSTGDIHFGIDNHKFSVHESLHKFNASPKGTSHYWFSTGEVSVPFNGKYLAPHKIQRIFDIIKETVEETHVLRFGVNEVEFSNGSKFYQPSMKSSIASEYSLNRNSSIDKFYTEADTQSGLLTTCSSWNTTAGLDDTDTGNEFFSVLSVEELCSKYESVPLNQLFAESSYRSYKQNQQKDFEQQQTAAMSVCEMFDALVTEKQRLSNVQQQLVECKPPFLTAEILNAHEFIPEYIAQLKQLISYINTHGGHYFKNCTEEDLDAYIACLNRYSKLCLTNCCKHLDHVLNALGN